VSQEPVLFNTSIIENLRYGNENATVEDCLNACNKANCTDFVKDKEGLNQIVGLSGSHLSGG